MDFYQVIQVDFVTIMTKNRFLYDIVFEWSKFYFWNLDRQSIQEASAGISNVILLNIFIMYTTRRDILFKFYWDWGWIDKYQKCSRAAQPYAYQ